MQRVSQYYRYCPGEEHTVISDAVCLGRRRTAYPKCKGCQFNDDEKGSPGAGAAGAVAARRQVEESKSVVESVFKAYDVRATYPEPLSEEVAWRIGHAAAQFLRAALRGIERAQRDICIVVGRDMRRSSPALAGALSDGIRSAGTKVVDVGMIDTSQLCFAVNYLSACGGVQTTASHNPANYNGFKICGQHGRPVGANTGLPDIARIAASLPKHETGAFADRTQRDLAGPYREFVRKFLKRPRRLKVVVDASNGMAGRWFPIIFDDVAGLDIIPLNFEHTGTFVHEPNPLVPANLAQLRACVRKRRADFGVCFDGDADRLMVVDEKAEIVSCDLLTALLAGSFLKDHPGSTIVYDLRSSRVVREEIRRLGGKARQERVGHAFMKKALADTDGVFGGELSGHFYFRDNWYSDSGMLAFVHLLNVASERGEPLSRLIAPLRRYAASGERNFQNEKKDETIRELARIYKDAKIDYLDGITVEYKDWWFNVRKSNTEPLLRLNLEARTAELMEAKLAEVAARLGRPVAH